MRILNNLNISKPTELSNPIQEYTESFLKSILDKKDNDLNGLDFNILLNIDLPSGTYDEVKYFLPLSYEYLQQPVTDQLEMIPSWVDFIFNKNEEIIKDFKVSAIDICDKLLTFLTLSYEEILMNEDECKANGWGITSYKYVNKSQMVCELLARISYYDSGLHWLKNLTSKLQSGSDVQKQWLYELYENSIVINSLLNEDAILKMLDT